MKLKSVYFLNLQLFKEENSCNQDLNLGFLIITSFVQAKETDQNFSLVGALFYSFLFFFLSFFIFTCSGVLFNLLFTSIIPGSTVIESEDLPTDCCPYFHLSEERGERSPGQFRSDVWSVRRIPPTVVEFLDQDYRYK